MANQKSEGSALQQNSLKKKKVSQSSHEETSSLSEKKIATRRKQTVRRDLRLPLACDLLAQAIYEKKKQKDGSLTLTRILSSATDIGLLIEAYRMGPDEHGLYGGGRYEGKDLAYTLRELTLGLVDFQSLQGLPLYPFASPLMPGSPLVQTATVLPSQATQDVKVDVGGAATLKGLGIRRIGGKRDTPTSPVT